MKITVQKKYLIFPVNTRCALKRLTFSCEGTEVYGLDLRLDALSPNFSAYIDVSRFRGQTLTLSVAPEMSIPFREADAMDIDGLYREPLRPQVHFTTKNGWLNDPNGLIFSEGLYHLFYQHNPAEPGWSNMHWGHAVSPDLLHWEERDIALFPTPRGAVYSGCAVADEHGLLGQDTVALFHTTTAAPYCQDLVLCDRKLTTFTPYAGNPVVPHIAGNNRDPKVVYCDELSRYLMVLYLEEDRYSLLSSADLVHWDTVQTLRLPGDSECPDLFPLPAENGTRRWVFIGAHGRYLVGGFENGQFVPCQPALTLQYGSAGYAGQTFAGLPHGRVVRLAWDVWKAPVDTFCGQMSFPVELSLCCCDGTYLLQAAPIAEIASLYGDTRCYRDLPLQAGQPFTAPLTDSAQVIRLRGTLPAAGALDMEIFGRRLLLHFSANEIQLGDSRAPLSVTGTALDLTVIVDRCSMEVFADGGKSCLSCLTEQTLCDRNLPLFTLQTDADLLLDALELHSLQSIWD